MDQPTTPEAPVDDFEQKLVEEVNSAWAKARDAVAEYGHAQYRLGTYRGFVDGYKEAQKKVLEKIQEFPAPLGARRVEGEASQPPPPITMPVPPKLPDATARPSAKDIVVDVIKANPGRTGVELLDILAKAGRDMKERTFRTQLFRLKAPKVGKPKDGQLVNHRGRWYVYPDVPADFAYTVNLFEGAGDPPPPKDEGGQQ